MFNQFLILALFLSCSLAAQEKGLPADRQGQEKGYHFPAENLEYSIWWGKPLGIFPSKIIKAGTGFITTKITTRSLHPAMMIKAGGGSIGLTHLIYPVNNFTKVNADPITFRPLSVYSSIEQGEYFRVTKMEFDYKENIFFYDDRLRDGPTMKITIDSVIFQNKNVFDLVTSSMLVRHINLQPADTLILDIFQPDEKSFPLKIVVLRRETIETIFGETRCLVIEPMLKNYAALFIKYGPLYIWLTDDDKKIPVKAETELIIGKIIVQLEKYEITQ